MRWAIKHKSGRTLFITSDEFIADNRRKMGWIVEEVKMTSREQFEKWVKEETGFDLWRTEYPMTAWDDQQYKCHQTNLAWIAWQASRAAIEIELKQFDHFQICHYGADERYACGYIDAQNNANKAIENAGLKVKK